MCIDTYMYALLKIQYYIKRSLVGGGLCFDTCDSLNDIDTLKVKRCAVGGVSFFIPVLYLLRLIHCRVCSGRDSCFDFCVLSDDIDML